MKYFGKYEDGVTGECQQCKKVWKIKKERYKYDSESKNYSINPPLICSCGLKHSTINKVKSTEVIKDKEKTCENCGKPMPIKGTICPHCNHFEGSATDLDGKKAVFQLSAIIGIIILLLIFAISSYDIGDTYYDNCIYGNLPGGESECGRPTENGAKYCPYHQKITGVYD